MNPTLSEFEEKAPGAAETHPISYYSNSTVALNGSKTVEKIYTKLSNHEGYLFDSSSTPVAHL